ncbi:CTP synthetase [Falsiphaeobacter marinintestinus]|uniref:CTP synthetase n=1 Tax=Falsiphaeobacter marinintestinus TaxID=1492905 RepID=UPI0011B652F2|nr:CTP synthetase [Phaeobacter marinintestinus]
MLRLAFILYLFIGSTLAGSAMIAALVSGFDTTQPIILSAAIGALVGLPVSWFVAQALYRDA